MAETEFVRRRLRVENVARRTELVWLFTFAIHEEDSAVPLAFEPGQVAVLSLPECGEVFLAIASAPHESMKLEFLVKGVNGVGAQLCDLGTSANVEIVGLVGRGFPIDDHAGKDLLFVAAGTAIAPIRAAIDHAIHTRERFGSITLVHGVRNPGDFAVDDEIDVWRAAGVDVRLTVTQPGAADWAGSVGRVQTHLATAVRDSFDTAAFVCGSPEMMEQSTELLTSLGVPSERIFRNY